MITEDQLAGIVTKLQDVAHAIAQSKEHAPMTFILNERSEILPVVHPFFEDGGDGGEAAKNAVAGALREIAKQGRAVALISVLEAWISSVPPELHESTESEILDAARRGQRDEVLLMTVEVLRAPVVMFQARVGIDGGHGDRKVGPWELFPSDMVSGRFAGLLDDTIGVEVGHA